jgi:hypothetical protein
VATFGSWLVERAVTRTFDPVDEATLLMLRAGDCLTNKICNSNCGFYNCNECLPGGWGGDTHHKCETDTPLWCCIDAQSNCNSFAAQCGKAWSCPDGTCGAGCWKTNIDCSRFTCNTSPCQPPI